MPARKIPERALIDNFFSQIRSRPHVLRLFDQPLENVITTGVTTATVEAMEAELKRDLLREREKTGGKVLLVSFIHPVVPVYPGDLSSYSRPHLSA